MSPLLLLLLPLSVLLSSVLYALRPILLRLPPALKHCRKRSGNLSRKEFALPPRKRGPTTPLGVRNAVLVVYGLLAITSLCCGWCFLANPGPATYHANTDNHATTHTPAADSNNASSSGIDSFEVASRAILALATIPVPALLFVLAAFSLARNGPTAPTKKIARLIRGGGVTHATLLPRILPLTLVLAGLGVALASLHILCLIALATTLAVATPLLGGLCYFYKSPRSCHASKPSPSSSKTTFHKSAENPSKSSEIARTSEIAPPPAATPRTPTRRAQLARLRHSRDSRNSRTTSRSDSWLSSPSHSVASLPEWDFTVSPDESDTLPSGSITAQSSALTSSTSGYAVQTLTSTARRDAKPLPVGKAYVLSSNNKCLSPRQWTFSSSAELMADSEWEAVDAPEGAEEWGRRGDVGACLMGVVFGVLSYAMEVPLLALGRHPATLGLFIAAISLPAPVLVAAAVLLRYKPQLSIPVPTIKVEDLGPVVDLTARPSEPTPRPDARPRAAKDSIYTVSGGELLKPAPAIVLSPRPKSWHDKITRVRRGLGCDLPGITISDAETSLSCDDHPLNAQIKVATRARRSPSPSYIIEPTRQRGDSSSTTGESCRVNSYCIAVDAEFLPAADILGLGAQGEITEAGGNRFKISTSTVDFSQAQASTPRRVGNPWTSNSDGPADLPPDLSMDWDAFDLPAVPPLPAKYSRGAYVASSSASRRVELESSQDAEASIARSAALARMLSDTPRTIATPVPAKSASDLCTPTPLSPVDSPYSTDSYPSTMTSFATRVAGFGKSSKTYISASEPETPSTVARMSPSLPPLPPITTPPPLPPLPVLGGEEHYHRPSYSDSTTISENNTDFTSTSDSFPESAVTQTSTDTHTTPTSAASSLRPLRLVEEQARRQSLKSLPTKAAKKAASRESVRSGAGVSKSRAGAPHKAVLAPISVNQSASLSISKPSVSSGLSSVLGTGRFSSQGSVSLGLGLPSGLGRSAGGVSVAELRKMGLPVPSRGSLGSARMSGGGEDKENVVVGDVARMRRMRRV